jgi:hypothetical protein
VHQKCAFFCSPRRCCISLRGILPHRSEEAADSTRIFATFVCQITCGELLFAARKGRGWTVNDRRFNQCQPARSTNRQLVTRSLGRVLPASNVRILKLNYHRPSKHYFILIAYQETDEHHKSPSLGLPPSCAGQTFRNLHKPNRPTLYFFFYVSSGISSRLCTSRLKN